MESERRRQGYRQAHARHPVHVRSRRALPRDVQYGRISAGLCRCRRSPIGSCAGVSGNSPALANDGMAELVPEYSDRFLGFLASLPHGRSGNAAARSGPRGRAWRARLADPHQHPRQSDRAPEYSASSKAIAKAGNCRCACIRSAARPIFDYGQVECLEYEIWWTFGWPYETSVAMARLVFAGYFDGFPRLKVITHHMGAMVPYFEGRVGPGWDQLGARTSDEDYLGAGIAAEAAVRLLQDVLRRHGALRLVRRDRVRAQFFGGTTCSSRPTRHSTLRRARCTSARR